MDDPYALFKEQISAYWAALSPEEQRQLVLRAVARRAHEELRTTLKSVVESVIQKELYAQHVRIQQEILRAIPEAIKFCVSSYVDLKLKTEHAEQIRAAISEVTLKMRNTLLVSIKA